MSSFVVYLNGRYETLDLWIINQQLNNKFGRFQNVDLGLYVRCELEQLDRYYVRSQQQLDHFFDQGLITSNECRNPRNKAINMLSEATNDWCNLNSQVEVESQSWAHFCTLWKWGHLNKRSHDIQRIGQIFKDLDKKLRQIELFEDVKPTKTFEAMGLCEHLITIQNMVREIGFRMYLQPNNRCEM